MARRAPRPAAHGRASSDGPPRARRRASRSRPRRRPAANAPGTAGGGGKRSTRDHPRRTRARASARGQARRAALAHATAARARAPARRVTRRSGTSSAFFGSGSVRGLSSTLPGREPLGADRHAQRDADEIRVLELHARALVAVVPEHLDAAPAERVVELLRRARARASSLPSVHECTWYGATLIGQRMPFVVVVLLDRRRDEARDADAVAAHHERLLLLLLVEEGRAHLRASTSCRG